MGHTLDSPRSLARYAGYAAVVVTLGGIFLATILSGSFAWTDSALSDLGVETGPVAPLLFNGGLVVGALLGLPYAALLWRRAESSLTHLVAVVLAAAICFMGLVGVFVEGTPLHFPVALTFYLLVTVLFALDGVARRNSRTGQVALAFAPLHVAVWVAWVEWFRPVAGLAVPETVGALLFATWVLFLSPLSIPTFGLSSPTR